jgi:hypothetical protein
MRGLDVELSWRRGDAREFRPPECLHLFDVALGVEQGHVRNIRSIYAETIPANYFVITLGIGQVLKEQLGQIQGTAAPGSHRKYKICHLGQDSLLAGCLRLSQTRLQRFALICQSKPFGSWPPHRLRELRLNAPVDKRRHPFAGKPRR